MFGFLKRVFVPAMIFLCCSLSNVNPLECISVNNEECQGSTEIVNVNSDEPVFFFLLLKQVYALVVVIISMIPMQNCVFLILLKI